MRFCLSSLSCLPLYLSLAPRPESTRAILIKTLARRSTYPTTLPHTSPQLETFSFSPCPSRSRCLSSSYRCTPQHETTRCYCRRGVEIRRCHEMERSQRPDWRDDWIVESERNGSRSSHGWYFHFSSETLLLFVQNLPAVYTDSPFDGFRVSTQHQEFSNNSFCLISLSLKPSKERSMDLQARLLSHSRVHQSNLLKLRSLYEGL